MKQTALSGTESRGGRENSAAAALSGRYSFVTFLGTGGLIRQLSLRNCGMVCVWRATGGLSIG